MSIEQLAEAYAVPGIGNPVDRTEFLYDDPSFGLGTWALGATTLSDRKDGKFFPVYQCETDLAMQRAQARALCGITRIHDGAMDALANYTFGQGFTFEVTCKAPGDHAPLMAYVQRIIDEFCDVNGMAGDLDREIHSRSRQDGEAFVKLRCDREGKIRAQILEPDQITEPGDARAVEDYEGLCRSIEDSPLNWAFGIATEKEDSSCVVGYYVKTDDGGADWEYLPIGRMQHFKRNVTRNAKRGVTDFYGIFSDFLNEAKLRRNSTTGAAVQAAIAWIVQYAPGVTSSQATSVGMTNSVATVGQATQGGIVQKNALHNPPGTVLRTGAGQTFMPGPMGAERNAGFVEIAQYALRAIGQRWNAPEYLISGDASNANYASSLVAESPFVKARQADQHWYGQQFKSLLWKVIEFHHRAGRFERFGCSMESLRHWCDIVVNYPTVESRNLGETAQALKILVDDLGIMSKRTAATKVDLDLDEELKQGAEAKALPQPMGLGGGFGGMMGGAPGAPGGMPGNAGPEIPGISESITEAERWITIGGDEDGGGVHVKVSGDGTITVGPAGLEGKKLGKKSGGGSPKDSVNGSEGETAKKTANKIKTAKTPKELGDLSQYTGKELNDWFNGAGRDWVHSHGGQVERLAAVNAMGEEHAKAVGKKYVESGEHAKKLAAHVAASKEAESKYGDSFKKSDAPASTGIGGKIADAVNNLVDRSIDATRKVDPSDTASVKAKESKYPGIKPGTRIEQAAKEFERMGTLSKSNETGLWHAGPYSAQTAADAVKTYLGKGKTQLETGIELNRDIQGMMSRSPDHKVGDKLKDKLSGHLKFGGFTGKDAFGRNWSNGEIVESVRSDALQSAITAALESVTTSAEARAILEQLTESEARWITLDNGKHVQIDGDGKVLKGGSGDLDTGVSFGGKIGDAVNRAVEKSIDATRKKDPSDTKSMKGSSVKRGIKISGPHYHYGAGELTDQPEKSGGWTFISPDPNYARNFKKPIGGKGVVVKSELKNVIDLSHIPGEGDVDASDVRDALLKYGIDIPEEKFGQGEVHQVLKPVRAEIRKQALSLGYDGIHQEENFDGQIAKTTAVFEPSRSLKHIQRNIESVQDG